MLRFSFSESVKVVDDRLIRLSKKCKVGFGVPSR